jgi:hypothetical protein
MEKTLNEYEIIEFEFATNLSRFLSVFNNIDTNLGLCISFLVNRTDPIAAHPFLKKLTTHGKIEVFKELILYKKSKIDESIVKDFSHWLMLFCKAKALRNNYVHCVWDVQPSIKEKPIRYHLSPWNIGEGKDKDRFHQMSLDEFKTDVQEMEEISKKFSELRNKYWI